MLASVADEKIPNRHNSAESVETRRAHNDCASAARERFWSWPAD